MTPEELRKELINEMTTAAPEEQQMILCYISGMNYAKANPNSDAAQILAEINSIVNQNGDREKVKELTLQLAELTAERN